MSNDWKEDVGIFVANQDIVLRPLGGGLYRLLPNPTGSAPVHLPGDDGELYPSVSRCLPIDMDELHLHFILRIVSGDSLESAIADSHIAPDQGRRLVEYCRAAGLLGSAAGSVVNPNAPLIVGEVQSIAVECLALARSIEFYRDILGLRVQRSSDGSIAVASESVQLRLVEVESVSRVAVAFALHQLHYEHARAVLAARGIGFREYRSSLSQSAVLSLHDPDDNEVEFVARPEPPIGRRIWSSESGNWSPVPVSEWRPKAKSAAVMEPYARASPNAPWYRESFEPLLADALVMWVPLPARIIECGCGYGFVASRLAALGYEVLALDATADAITHCKKVFGDLNPRLSFSVCDVTASIEATRADCIVDEGCFHSFGHVPEKRNRYIENLTRVLPPGGKLIITCRSSTDPLVPASSLKWSAAELVQVFFPYFVPRFQTIYTQAGVSATYNKEKRLFSVFERVDPQSGHLTHTHERTPTVPRFLGD